MTSSNGNIFHVIGPFVQGIHRSPGEFPSQRPVMRSVDVFFICSWMNDLINNHEAGDLRRHHAYHDSHSNVRKIPHGFISYPRGVYLLWWQVIRTSASWHHEAPATSLFIQLLVWANNNELIKTLFHWHFVRGIHLWLLDSHHKGPMCWKCFNVITLSCNVLFSNPKALHWRNYCSHKLIVA